MLWWSNLAHRTSDVRVHIMWGEKIKELGFVGCYIQFFLEFQHLWKVTLKLPKQTEVNLLSVPYRGFLLSFNYAEQLLLTGFYILDSIHLSERMFSSNKISENRKKSKPVPGADLGGGCRRCAPPPPPEMTCGFLIQLVFCEKKLCGLLVLKKSKRRVHPPPLLKKILDPPLIRLAGWIRGIV